MRVGIGFDAHAFDAARPLVLGGVTIEGGPGLAGHSDADVLCHAIADAVLGAASLGDIGAHFPDTDPAWKNASSMKILARVAELVADAGFSIESVDATVLIEAPRIAPHRDAMCANIRNFLRVSADRVSVKASTMEGLGTVGRREGAACMAVALLGESKADD